MIYQYFNKCNSKDEARKQYIDLVKEYHPDKNPELSEAECNNITSKIIMEYKKVLDELDKPKDTPKPKANKPKKPKAHKSPENGFYQVSKGNVSSKSKSKVNITRKQAKEGVDIIFDALKLFKSIRK